ncbi:AI-2E family transporter [Clostridium sp. 'deep sea']|uniref:AI-2E family transporter n=1 Tax=Clostridium sp. 'deep sea' TaxID=2779445 RepID=UPI0018966115|nr:AI-2E family transporter [Clostridium sp. 'deep sea']QOR36548.1 AI-2E family transporter [Clostridium sp. 'deep sea']
MNDKRSWQSYFKLLPLILTCIILFKVVDSSEMFSNGLGFFVSIFTYFIWAFLIAYFLNPLMVIIDKKTKGRRWVTLFILYAIVIGCIVLVIRIVSPNLTRNISDLAEAIPGYYKIAQKWVTAKIAEIKVNDSFGLVAYLETAFSGIAAKLTETITQILNGVLTGVLRGTNLVATFLMGLVISVYMLKEKEIIINSSRKLVKAVFKKGNMANKVLKFGQDVDDIFSKYIIGKVIDSIIIGIMCYVGLAIMKIPYAIVLGLVVGITNMIPYFGPFIGMIPAFIITLFAGFWQAIATVLFIFLLQQFDGWYLGPRILGGSVGLSPLWIIMAITIGGKLYGIAGMFLGVPAMAVIKKLLNEFIESRGSQ